MITEYSASLSRAGVLLIVLDSAGAAWCQDSTLNAPKTADSSRREFEFASVRPGDKTSQNMSFKGNSQNYIAENAPLRSIILDAFDSKDYLFVGPDWLAEERYTIIAKVSGNTTPSDKKLMMQSLLVDRFQMTFHHEKAERVVYALLVAKGGPRLEPITEGGQITVASGAGVSAATGDPPPGVKFTIIGKVSLLADALSRRLGRPVLDKTGIDGRFKIAMSGFEWPAQQISAELPSVFTAIQQQLGLRLEPQRGQVEILVIDHIDRTAAEN